MQNKNRGIFGWLLAIVLLFSIWSAFGEFASNAAKSDYSSLIRYIKDGSVSELYISSTTARAKVGDKVITGKYSGTEVKLNKEEYTIVRQSDILAVVE